MEKRMNNNRRDGLILMLSLAVLLSAAVLAGVAGGGEPAAGSSDSETTDASNIVYVSGSGSDTGDGTRSSPYQTIETAYSKVTDGGTICLLSDITMSKNLAASTKSVTITAEKETDGKRYKICGNVTGQGNKESMFQVSGGRTVTFTDVVVDGTDMPHSGTWCGAIYVYNGTVNLGSGAVIQNFIWSGTTGAMAVLYADTGNAIINIQDGSRITGCIVYGTGSAAGGDNPASIIVAGSGGKVRMTGGSITGNGGEIKDDDDTILYNGCTAVVALGLSSGPSFYMTGG